MYEARFGLSCAPFRSLPDPRFYLDEGQYGRLISELIQGLEAGEPCLLLTGRPGSGKTAMVRRLMTLLDRSGSTAGTMFATAGASGADVLRAAMHAFDLARPQTHPGPAFDDWLSSQAAQGNRVLLIVDEAEHLNDEALSELVGRVAPGSKTRALQLCLVGQQAPVGLAGLVRDGLLPAVAVHCRLRALEATETRHYVLHRLRCASWMGRPAIDRAATDAIHRRSAGIPRRIHRIADGLLQQMALEGAEVATAAAVEAADDGWPVELQGRAPIEALPVNTGLLARAGPGVDTPDYELAAAVQHIAPAALIAPPSRTAPRWPAARVRKTAAGAAVVALAVIANGWWLGIGRAVPPSAAQRSLESDTARPMFAAPAGGMAQPAGFVTPAADPAPVAQTAPTTAWVTADPAPVASALSANPDIAAPPTAAAVLSSGGGGMGAAPLPRPGIGITPSARLGHEAMSPAGLRRNARRGAEPVPADAMPAGDSPADAETSAPRAAPQPSCTGTAAVLGLCVATPSRTPQLPRPARRAEPATDLMPPEPLRVAAPASPCEPSREALGLCER